MAEAFFEEGVAGLDERPRRDRPPVFSPRRRRGIKALACELPVRLGLPLSRLSIADLRPEALQQGVVATISETTIWRWLAEDAIRPWTHRSWVFPRDPKFGVQAGRVLDLYAREWEGQPLGRRDCVLCADEKTSIQARGARPPDGRARAGRCGSNMNMRVGVPSPI